MPKKPAAKSTKKKPHQAKPNPKRKEGKPVLPRKLSVSAPVEPDLAAVSTQAIADEILAYVQGEEGGASRVMITDQLPPDLYGPEEIDQALKLLVRDEQLVCHGGQLYQVPSEEPESVEGEVDEDPSVGAEDDPEEAAADTDPAPAPKANGANGHSNGVAAFSAPEEYRPTRYLRHVFTQTELDEFHAQRLELDREADELNEDLKPAQEKVRDLKKRIDELTDDARTLSRRERLGAEMQYVRCEERKCIDPIETADTYGRLAMVTFRLDTNEPIESRALRGAERQGSLFDPTPEPVVVPAPIAIETPFDPLPTNDAQPAEVSP